MKFLLPVALLATLAAAQVTPPTFAPTTVPSTAPSTAPTSLPAVPDEATTSQPTDDTSPAPTATVEDESPRQPRFGERGSSSRAWGRQNNAGDSDKPADGEGLRNYRLLTERNIFLSTRRARRTIVRPTRTVTPPVVPPPSDPRADWVFRGSIHTDRGFGAIVEHVGNGETNMIYAAETLQGQTVQSVSLDQMTLVDPAGASLTIDVSQNLLGRTVAAATPAVSTTPTRTSRPTSTTPSPTRGFSRESSRGSSRDSTGPRAAAAPSAPPPSTAAPAASAESTAAMLQRLRQRRLQRTGTGQ